MTVSAGANASLTLLRPNSAVPATFVGTGGYSADSLGQNGTGLAVIAITAEARVTTEICTDGIDNDGDGLIDSDDPDCVAPPQQRTAIPTLQEWALGLFGLLLGGLVWRQSQRKGRMEA